MKKNKILSLISLLLGCFMMLSACSTPTAPSETFKNETAEQLYANAKQSLAGKNYGDAIKRFEAFETQHPLDSHLPQAQLNLIYAYYMKDEFALSASSAERFIRNYPFYTHLDYVLYIRGLANFYQNLGILERMFSVDLSTRDLTQIEISLQSFSELLQRFPNSEYAPAASQQMIYLRNFMAQHELQTAQYYYDHAAYVASANRAQKIILQYQGAPQVIPALKLLKNSYEKLGLTSDAKKAQAYLMANE